MLATFHVCVCNIIAKHVHVMEECGLSVYLSLYFYSIYIIHEQSRAYSSIEHFLEKRK